MSRIVTGLLHSPTTTAAATSILGRQTLRILSAHDIGSSVEDAGACALLYEPGHPGFEDLYTRLSVVGSAVPLIVVLSNGLVHTTELLALSRISAFSFAYDPCELGGVLRRTMTRGFASSDVQIVGAALNEEFKPRAAAISLGLYVAGVRNVSVTQAAARMGFPGGIRNRLRGLGLARASTILGWASAMAVVWRMEQEDCTLAAAARALGFDTTRQCSDRILYHTGRTPSTLRDRYGFQALVDEFIDVVSTRVFSAA